MKLLKKHSIIFIFPIILAVIITSFFCYDVGGYQKFISLVKRNSKEAGVSQSLVFAIIKTESNFNKNAVSKKGAIGLMQITNRTAKYVAEFTNFNGNLDLFNEEVNVYLGVQYLKYLSQKFSDENAVICAYNAGETKVKEWLNESQTLIKEKVSYKESKKYLTKVKRRQKLYKILIN